MEKADSHKYVVQNRSHEFLAEMKKEFFKNSKTYAISIIGVPPTKEDILDQSITTLNYKTVPEVNNDNILVKENESDGKFKNEEVKGNEGCDFETAIKAAEYGKFHWLLLFAVSWGYMSCMNATTTMSLILPSAECDLNLSNFDKGMLNSFIYIGMTLSAFFWGLASDAVGRKNVLLVGFALDAFFSILVGLAQNFTFLLIAKLFSGFISSGPIAILASFLAENHANVHRASVILCTGMFTSLATIVLPFLAWLIIPRPIRIVLFGGYIVLPSWRIFLLVSAIPSVMAFIGISLFEESPKFLMFQGKNEKALKVLQKIYSVNTGKPKETFPIKSLQNEMGENQMGGENSTIKQIIYTGLKQMVPIFQKPYLPLALLPCIMQFCTLLGVNTIRLWSPQLFASAIEKEKYDYNNTFGSTICELLVPVSKTKLTEKIVQCGEHIVEDKVYFNSMITGLVTGIGYLISGYVVKNLEKKWLMIMAYGFGISCCVALYWSTSSNYMLGVISVFIAVTSTSATAIIGAVVDIFPTSLRTTAVSLCMTFGRMGALTGNLVFPVLLDWHCTFPFILLAIVLSVASGLALLLPKTKGKHLE